jgi:thermitase
MIKILLIVIFLITSSNLLASSKSCSLLGIKKNIMANTNYKIPSLKFNKEIKIAIIDTGIDFSNKELMKRVYTPTAYKKSKNSFGYNALDNSNFPFEDELNPHGSHVAGVLLALFPNAKIFPIKYYDSKKKSSKTFSDSYLKALEVAVYSDAELINISGGGEEAILEEVRLLKIAKEKGKVVIVAAGNNAQNISKNNKTQYFPASYGMGHVISVANHNKDNQLALSSNWGDTVDIAAYGSSVKSFGVNGKCVSMTGTSQATPIITAIVAMIKAKNGSISNEDVKPFLTQNSLKYPQINSKIKSGIANFNIFANLPSKISQVKKDSIKQSLVKLFNF